MSAGGPRFAALFLLAAAWGVSYAAESKTVWFRLPTGAASNWTAVACRCGSPVE